MRNPIMTMTLVVALIWSGIPPALADSPTPAPEGGVAVGDLLVAPTRFVFEGNRRSAEVTLVNVGQTTATYRISFIWLEMSEAGAVNEIEPPGDAMLAEPLIRYSPRQVTLEPQVAQTVRMQLRRPAGLAPGEYRSHMLFRALPPPDFGAPAEDESAGLQVRLIPVYGVSIPVIVRHETTPSVARFESVSIEPGSSEAQPFDIVVAIGRDGLESLYGDLRVIQSVAGREQVIGTRGGVAVYTPLARRQIRVPLTPMPGVPLDRSRIIIRYQTADPEPRVMAEAGLGDAS